MIIAITLTQVAHAQSSSDSTAMCWGRDWYGALSPPRPLSGVRAVSAGWFHSVAIRGDGRVVCWGAGGPGTSGWPNFGQSSPPNIVADAVDAGAAHCIAASGGWVYCWGDNTQGQCNVPAGLGNVGSVAAGGVHSLALRTCCGMAYAWGNNAYGQCSVPTYLGGAAQVAAGYYHSIVRFSDGSVRCWGSDAQGQCSVPADLGTVAFASAGWSHSIAIRTDGSIRCWGDNTQGQCNVPPGMGTVVQADGGQSTTVVLLSNGSVRAWGEGFSGVTAVPSTVRKAWIVAAGAQHAVVAYDNCPEVPNPTQSDCNFDGVGDACEIAAGAQDFNHNGVPDSCECLGDVYVDRIINGADLAALLAFWGPVTASSASLACDLDANGVVNGADLGMLLGNWGPCSN